jgi:hypothetical protein
VIHAIRRLFGLIMAGAAGSGAIAQTDPPVPQCHIYAAIIQVTVDSAGHITGLHLDRVIDPSGPGSQAEVASRAVPVNLPPMWLSSVRAFLETRHYSGSPSVFYTYALYNPTRPTDANADPRGCDPEVSLPR